MKYLPLTVATVALVALSLYAFQLKSELEKVRELAGQYRTEAMRNEQLAKLNEAKARAAEAMLSHQAQILCPPIKK